MQRRLVICSQLSTGAILSRYLLSSIRFVLHKKWSPYITPGSERFNLIEAFYCVDNCVNSIFPLAGLEIPISKKLMKIIVVINVLIFVDIAVLLVFN